ncbi:hypothetical protein ACHQM5_004442 [Ranunculus cassubicifolius]
MMNIPTKSLAMRRNMNLDLCLSSPSSSNSGSSSGERKKEQESGETQLQRMTIFYNGKVSVCDATEEAEEEKQRNLRISESVHASPSQLYSSTEISMKRSLQKFLEKRRDRIQSTKSPYRR